MQGFHWNQSKYSLTNEQTNKPIVIKLAFSEFDYLILAKRYKELSEPKMGPSEQTELPPYDLVGHLTEIDTEIIDANFMNSRFEKYLKVLHLNSASAEDVKKALSELHKTFATLSQEEQKYANLFLHDIERGDVAVEAGKTFREYVTEYQYRAHNDQIHRMAEAFGLDEAMLRNMMEMHLTVETINEYGKLSELKKTIDKEKTQQFFERVEGKPIPMPRVNIKADLFLRDFILSGGYDIGNWQEGEAETKNGR